VVNQLKQILVNQATTHTVDFPITINSHIVPQISRQVRVVSKPLCGIDLSKIGYN